MLPSVTWNNIYKVIWTLAHAKLNSVCQSFALPYMPCGLASTPSRHPPCPRFYGNAGNLSLLLVWTAGTMGLGGGKLTPRPSCPLLTGGIYGDFYEFLGVGGGGTIYQLFLSVYYRRNRDSGRKFCAELWGSCFTLVGKPEVLGPGPKLGSSPSM